MSPLAARMHTCQWKGHSARCYTLVQVSAAVLSADGSIDPLVLAINASSAALMCSHIPWAGPVAAVRVARVGGQLVLNPSAQDAGRADMSLLYAGIEEETVMLDLQVPRFPSCETQILSL